MATTVTTMITTTTKILELPQFLTWMAENFFDDSDKSDNKNNGNKSGNNDNNNNDNNNNNKDTSFQIF